MSLTGDQNYPQKKAKNFDPEILMRKKQSLFCKVNCSPKTACKDIGRFFLETSTSRCQLVKKMFDKMMIIGPL
jgi:hypothetical protein